MPRADGARPFARRILRRVTHFEVADWHACHGLFECLTGQVRRCIPRGGGVGVWHGRGVWCARRLRVRSVERGGTARRAQSSGRSGRAKRCRQLLQATVAKGVGEVGKV